MRLLLDTKTFLWFIVGDLRLSVTARQMIESSSNVKLLSTASLWEMAIKSSQGRLSTQGEYDRVIDEQLVCNGIGVLDIRRSHLAELRQLPFHHRDPFDRLIIAQCIAEQLLLVAGDTTFDRYDVQRLW